MQHILYPIPPPAPFGCIIGAAGVADSSVASDAFFVAATPETELTQDGVEFSAQPTRNPGLTPLVTRQLRLQAPEKERRTRQRVECHESNGKVMG